jgi:hypothetical protein
MQEYDWRVGIFFIQPASNTVGFFVSYYPRCPSVMLFFLLFTRLLVFYYFMSYMLKLAAIQKQAIMWGGGQIGLHPKGKGVGMNLGYSNFLGLIPVPLTDIDIGGPNKGFQLGVTADPESEIGVAPLIGMRWNHPRTTGVSRNFPRGFLEMAYDKLRGRTRDDVLEMHYPGYAEQRAKEIAELEARKAEKKKQKEDLKTQAA